ncbi:LacI family DNA-binding transcriptional regulator [Streptomyces malaysiensis]|uniref:LacI family DNA-binding transcriptional regulator n=1 Tax=Streptomyces malaysiensis TaxID=92644 RepID=UPI0036A6B914
MSAHSDSEPALTMRDVAARLGVSPMTVSRALRGQRGIGEATRQRVLAEVAALGYRPNKRARELRSGGPSELIGLVVTNLANPFYSQLAVGLEQISVSYGARVMLGSTGEDPATERDVVADLVDRGVDGLVVVPAGHDHGHLGGLRDVPVVLAASPPMGIDVDCVLVDDFGGTRDACRRLVARGHRRIGFLGLPPSLWTGSERFRGYAVALEEAGIALDERYVSQHRGDSGLAEEAARAMLALPDPPTALLTANNRNTVGALRALRDRAPDEEPVSLAGFDDIELADMLHLPLTVVSYDPVEIGRAAAKLLFERQASTAPQPPRRVTIATTLVDHPAPR